MSNGAAAIKTDIELVQQCEVVLNAFQNLTRRCDSENSFLRFPLSYVHLPVLTMHIKSQGWIMKPVSHKLQRHGQIPLRFRPHEYESKLGKVTAREMETSVDEKTVRKEREEWRTKTEQMKSRESVHVHASRRREIVFASNYNQKKKNVQRLRRSHGHCDHRPFFCTAVNFVTSSARFQADLLWIVQKLLGCRLAAVTSCCEM